MININKKAASVCAKAFAAVMLAAALVLTFTLSDYYIFNRIAEFGAFAAVQWIKKAGLLLVAGAVFFGNRRCADSARYIIPVAVIISFCTFGSFFDVTKPADSDAQEIYNSINLFMPKAAHMALFFTEGACMLAACALLFFEYGFAVRADSFIYFAAAIIAAVPLNVFENFFDIDLIPQNSFLRFRNFTVWHFVAIAALAGATIGGYYFLKNKPRAEQCRWLCAAAGALLLQYHSKDSMVMGDGYNVYHTVFACIPLFICNIGVYISSLSVFLRKKVLYATSFFVHAGGAISVFVYFGKDSMSNYGIFCSYSILYFCFTHIFLFMLCVLPPALGMYRFRIKDCIVPLVYYFCVIVIASIASAAVTGFSIRLGLEGDDIIMPNYAFTQINPLPFEVPPVIVLNLWGYEINVLYVLGLYAAYVAIFFAFYGFYRLFLFARMRVLNKYAAKGERQPARQEERAGDEAAAALFPDDEMNDAPTGGEQKMPIDAAICRNQLRPTYLLNKKFKGARRLKNNHNAFTRDEITGVLYMEIVKNKLNENFINYRIAHRGLHSDGVCENSLEAFRRAIEAGYGIELDVHLTADGKLCVIHDCYLSRMTGKPGVAEQLTSEELKEYRLKDGQHIPMLPEVLELVAGRVPILIELKFRRRFNEAQADELLRELESYAYKDMVALQSFHPLAVKYLKEHTAEYPVGYLCSYRLIRKKRSFLNYMLRTLKFYRYMHADFISYDITYLPNRYVAKKKKRGVQVLAWTVNSKEKERRAMRVADNIIFENIEPF